jgi:hypothetical protein
MGKRKDTEEQTTTSADITETPAAAPAKDGFQETQIALALIETLKSEPSIVETPRLEPTASVTPAIEIENPAPLAEMPKPVEIPKPMEIPKPIELSAPDFIAAPPLSPASEPSVNESAGEEPPRSNRFTLLAASVAIAAAIGAMTGAIMASALAWVGSAPPAAAHSPLAAADLSALNETIGKMRSEIAALRAGVDTGTRSTNAQFAKVTERFDRLERATDPAKLAKALEARKVDANIVTGSIAQQKSEAAPVPPPAPRTSVIDGWVIRNVSRGVAVIQGRRMGVIEVERGDIVPGLGRIEAIRRQDGHWVVVTAKGLILPPR